MTRLQEAARALVTGLRNDSFTSDEGYDNAIEDVEDALAASEAGQPVIVDADGLCRFCGRQYNDIADCECPSDDCPSHEPTREELAEALRVCGDAMLPFLAIVSQYETKHGNQSELRRQKKAHMDAFEQSRALLARLDGGK